jgi:hypothetical protein
MVCPWQPVLPDQHLPHTCFRRISPQRFLVSRFVAKTWPAFRSLWQESGRQDENVGPFGVGGVSSSPPPLVPDHPGYARAAALGSAVWVKCTGTRQQALRFFGYEWLQAKAFNGSRYDGGRPNRGRSHTRASNMGVAEGQNARSSDYRQSTRLTSTEVKPAYLPIRASSADRGIPNRNVLAGCARLDTEHVELALDVTEDEIVAGHCAKTPSHGRRAAYAPPRRFGSAAAPARMARRFSSVDMGFSL